MAERAAVGELEWSDLRVVLAICRSGSLSGAARALRCNHSTVFRRINAIEETVGVRFFERLPTGYAMTEAGEVALAYAERIEAEFHGLSREVLGRDLRLQGKVCVTAPEGMAGEVLPPLLATFRAAHPEVTIDLLADLSAVDLGRREADLAIRATRAPPENGLGRKICRFRFCAYAAPAYLARVARTPLADRDWVVLRETDAWLVPLVWKTRERARQAVVLRASTTEATAAAARAGIGMTFLPCYVGDPAPGLQRVGEPYEPLTLDLWVLTHPVLRHTARVKALMSFLADALVERASLFEGR